MSIDANIEPPILFDMASEVAEETAVANAWEKKLPPFTKEGLAGCVVAESSFATLFPEYREAYIKECFPLVRKSLSEHGITSELDLVSGFLKVSTTKDTWDPYVILKARDLIKLIARSVPYEQAVKVLQDDINMDIIKMGGLVSTKERFVKRRERLIGPNGSTLKAIELLTNCYVQIQGNTCTALGPYRGLAKVRQIVQEAMRNIHPIYTIKTLMIMRELEHDSNLKHEDWNRFLPKFASKNVKRKNPKIKNRKKDYTPFPPPQPESKIDKELASGEYFMKDKEKMARELEERKKKTAAADVRRQLKRQQSYIPPEEPDLTAKKPRKIQSTTSSVDIANLKKKIQKAKKRRPIGILNASKSTGIQSGLEKSVEKSLNKYAVHPKKSKKEQLKKSAENPKRKQIKKK